MEKPTPGKLRAVEIPTSCIVVFGDFVVDVFLTDCRSLGISVESRAGFIADEHNGTSDNPARNIFVRAEDLEVHRDDFKARGETIEKLHAEVKELQEQNKTDREFRTLYAGEIVKHSTEQSAAELRELLEEKLKMRDAEIVQLMAVVKELREANCKLEAMRPL